MPAGFSPPKAAQIATARFVTAPHRSAQGTPTSTTASLSETRKRKRKIKIGRESAARCCCLIGGRQSLVAQFFAAKFYGAQGLATRDRHFDPRHRTPHSQRATQQLKAAWKRERERSAWDLSLLSEWWQLTTCPNFRRPTVWRSRHSHPQPPLHFLPLGAQNLAAALLAIDEPSSYCPVSRYLTSPRPSYSG